MHRETMYSHVEGAVATIVLNRPRVLNCANEPWVRDFHLLLDGLASADGLRVVVIRAEGRAFCSGIDLTALSQGEIGSAFFRQWEEALRRLEAMDQIVVAAVHSHCIGGGLQLALACDLRMARDDARFGITALTEGIIPGMGMWRLARHVGLGRAKRLALAAEVIDAQTALAWGLVDYVVAETEFETLLAELIARLLATGHTSAGLTKNLTNMAYDTSWAECLGVFCRYQQIATASAEHRQAMEERRTIRAASRAGQSA